MAQPGQDAYGEPEQWEFDYPWDNMVKTGFWLWAMSGFKELKTQDEIMAYDPRWIGDMHLAYTLYSHQKNQSAVMKLFENYMAFKENPAEYRKLIEQEKSAKERDTADARKISSRRGSQARRMMFDGDE